MVIFSKSVKTGEVCKEKENKKTPRNLQKIYKVVDIKLSMGL